MKGTWGRFARALPRARLSLQLVVFETLLIAVVVGSAFLALNVEIRAITKRFFVAELRRTQRQILGLQNRSLEQLVWTSAVLTQSPTLRAAIETYRLEAPAGGERAELLGTIQREVERIGAGLGKDLLIVTDSRGRVLAASERGSVSFPAGDDLASLLIVRRALDISVASDASNFGVARLHGMYYQIGCVPIVLQGVPIGTLILGERLDAFVARLRQEFDGEIVVTGEGRVLATTVSRAPLEAGRFAALGEGGGETGTVRVGDEEFVGAPLTLGTDALGGPAVLYLLHPLSILLAPLDRALRVDFLFYGFLALVLAALGALLVSGSVTSSLRHFVGFMESVAQSGDYSRAFDSGPAPAEIRALNASYDHLISSLAHKHTELVQRTAELSLANVELTGHIQERERAEVALRSSEAQLRQSQKLEAIGTLAGGVAHDFNNLLTVIQSYTELTLADLPPSGRMREDLEQVKQAAVRAAGLTKQLLAFSRKQVMQPKVLDVNTVVAGVEKMLRRLIGEDIDLQTAKAGSLSHVLADPGQLEQVIVNLVVNARDAMPQGGRIVIATANVHVAADSPDRVPVMAPGEWVLISVSDSGEGMDEATRARIFEPFFTTKEAGKGTGLGLSTVYGIVKQSSGFITVTSERGRGTTFRIYLPPMSADAETTTTPAGATGLARGAETILVVEDEEPVRLLACRCLSDLGYRVLDARHAEEAERVAGRHPGPIHLLLTDVVMPGSSGRELRDRLVPRYPAMRVLFMSGYTNDAVLLRGVIGADIDLLEKPFTPAALGRRVRDILDRPGPVSRVRVET